MDSMLPWIANFLANTATQIAGVTNMLGALLMGLLAAIIGLIAWHRHRRNEGKRGVEPSALIIFGLIGVALCALLAASGYIWQQSFQSQPSTTIKTSSNQAELITIEGRFFQNQRVVLDGFRYVNCTFTSVTLVFNGGKFSLERNRFLTSLFTASDKAELETMVKVLFDLGFMRVPVITPSGQILPSNPIPDALNNVPPTQSK